MNPAIDCEAQRVIYTQKVFRSLLDSMARPGKINLLEPFPLHYTAQQISSASYILGIACTLLDIEVGFYIVSQELKDLITDIEFHSNARTVLVPEADYIVMMKTDDPKVLLDAKHGDLDYPDNGATVILAVDAISDDPAHGQTMDLSLILEGPGVLHQKAFFVNGMDNTFIRTLQSINAEFPLGLDLIMVSQDKVACFPRSLTIKIKDES